MLHRSIEYDIDKADGEILRQVSERHRRGEEDGGVVSS